MKAEKNWVDYRSNEGITALAMACASGKTKIVKELIHQGNCSVNESMKDDWTAIAHAIKNSRLPIIKMLQQEKCKWDYRLKTRVKRIEKNRTLLMLAVVYRGLLVINRI